MSLFESGHTTGDVSLAALFDGHQQRPTGGPVDVPMLVERIVVGIWPALLGATVADSQRWVRDHLRNVVEIDIPGLGHRQASGNLMRLMQSLGCSVGQAPKLSDLHKEVAVETGTFSFETLAGYLQALERLTLTEVSKVWLAHMQSRFRQRSAPVRYFVDRSIGAAALGVGPRQPLDDLNAAGFHFDVLAVSGHRQPSARDNPAAVNRTTAATAVPDGRLDSWPIHRFLSASAQPGFRGLHHYPITTPRRRRKCMSTSDAMPPQQPDASSAAAGWTDPSQPVLTPPVPPVPPVPPQGAPPRPSGGGPTSNKIVMLVAVALVAGIAAFIGSMAGGFASGLVGGHGKDGNRSNVAGRDFGNRQQGPRQQGPGQQGPGQQGPGRGGNGPYAVPAPTATTIPTPTPTPTATR